MNKIAWLFLSVFACIGTANAAPIGFNGDYDFSTWSQSTIYDGTVMASVDGTQQTLTLLEHDSYPITPWAPLEFTFSHIAVADGVVSFDWLFDSSADACCSGLNFYVDGVLNNLAGGYFGDPYHWDGTIVSGSFSTFVNAGSTIAFGAFSADSCCLASISTITNFDAPTSVPEPASLALLGLGLAGIGFSRRKKNI